MSALFTVHTGQWTDYTRGSVLGSEITLSSTSARILTAGIAIFLSFVGAVTWMIICFIFHQAQASRNPAHGFDHQILAMFRNSSSAFAFTKDLALAGWSWRKKSRSIFLKAAGLASFSMTIFITFSVASVFLSLIAHNGRVLMNPTLCGQLVPETDVEVQNLIRAVESLQVQNFRTSVVYSQNCYGIPQNLDAPQSNAQFAPAADCNFYVTPSIPYNISFDHACPFKDADLCSVPSSQIIRLETDLVNSNQHLGMNGPVSNQVSFRLRSTCSPLDARNHSTNGFVTMENGESAAEFYFGRNILKQVGEKYNHPNTTFLWSRQAFESRTQPYNLKVVSSLPQNSAFWRAHFNPIDALSMDDAVTTLMFLSTQGYYEGRPSNDPWFAATERIDNDPPLYYSDGPGVVVGCAESWQVCNPASNKCGPFHGITRTKPEEINALKFNPIQEATYWNYLEAYMPSIGDPGFNLDMFALDAFDRLALTEGLLSRPIPSNQWHREMTRFFTTTLAFFQRGVITGVTNSINTPSSYVDVAKLSKPYPEGSPMDYLCKNQQINSSDYVSFPVIGIALIFGLGGLVIVAGVMITILVPMVQKRIGKGEFARNAWQNDGLLQIQRSFFELLSLGKWEDGFVTVSGQIPRTKTVEKFCSPIRVNGSFGNESDSEFSSPTRADSFNTTKTVQGEVIEVQEKDRAITAVSKAPVSDQIQESLEEVSPVTSDATDLEPTNQV